MKKFAVMVFAAAMVATCAAQASALTFTLEGYEVDYLDSDPGLVLYVNDVMEDTYAPFPISANINEGDTVRFAMFEIGTNEGTVNWSDDIYDSPISVSFDFSSPEVDQVISGESWGSWLWQEGVVEWDGPTDFYFGNGGHFSIELDDVYFGTPGSAIVYANLHFVSDSQSDPTAPVPEPASMLLLGSGLVGIAVTLRRKNKA